MKKYDILNLEWRSSGRDINIIEPVLCYLEKFAGYSVKRTSYLFSLFKVLYYKPRMLVLSNNVGAIRNYYASKMAFLLGIKVVTLSSEGDYNFTHGTTQDIESFFWGWDLKREFPVDLHLEWSQKNVDLIKKYIAGAEYILEKTRVSGATGFDRYKMFSFKGKNDFLKDKGLNKYKQVIGYAAWGFDLFYERSFLNAPTVSWTDGYISFHKNNGKILNGILKQAINDNKDTLFILKRHPGEECYGNTELAGLEKYDNVIIIYDEESIEDLISVSDIWMAYESTTCLEAWLMGKQTVLINPVPFTGNRSDIAYGSPVRSNYEELQQDISLGRVVGFEHLQEKRDEIIKRVIEYADGKNHVRAAEYIIEEFKKEPERKPVINCWIIVQLLKELAKMMIFYSFLRRIPFFADRVEDCDKFFQMYSVEERDAYVRKYSEGIENFDN